MTLLTPPSSSQRDREKAGRSRSGRVAWSQKDRYHSLATPPRPSLTSSAKKEPPARSILKRPSYPILPLLTDKPREETPEPHDPLADLHYLDYPVSRIVTEDTPLRDLIEAHSILAARLRAAVHEETDADCSWPLFQPLRKQSTAFVDAVVRDLARAMVDPMADGGDENEPCALLPSPQKSPRKRSGMTEDQVKHARDLCTTTHAVLKLLGFVFTVPAIYRVFDDSQLGLMLTHVLAIPLASTLPTPNARKTCALAIWLLQTQRLPAAVLAPATVRIAYALRRAIEGELGKEGKKGSASDGLRAIHDLALHDAALFVPAFEPLLRSIFCNLLAPTLNLRAMACHALGGLALASSHLPRAPLHTRLSDTFVGLLTDTAEPGVDPLIVRTLRTTLNQPEPVHAAQGPVWALCTLASCVVLLGPAVCTNTKLSRIVSALLALALRHKKSAVRGLAALVWRPIAWVFFRPALLPADDEDGDLSGTTEVEETTELTAQEEVRRVGFWRVMRSVVEMGAGTATVGAVLANRTDSDEDLEKVLAIVKQLVNKNGPSCRDAIEVVRRLVSSEEAQEWVWRKLLPPSLFSANPGLMTVDFRTLSTAVRPIIEEAPGYDDVRPLTRTELSSPGVLDGLVEVFKEALRRINLSPDAQLPDEFTEAWTGLLTAAVNNAQDSEQASGSLPLADRVGSILSDVLKDQDVNFCPEDDSPRRNYRVADADILPDRALSPHARSNAAMKLSVTRDLWSLASNVVPADELGAAGEILLGFLIQGENDLVWETDSPHDARVQWALLCAEVLVCCRAAPLKVFWGVKGTQKKWTWEWADEVRSLVWRTFSERWREIGREKWENALFLLGVPFSDKDAWEMSSEDLDSWDSTLQFCIDKSLDEGIDTVRILDHVASIISSTHIPTSTSSTRVADLLLSHMEITEAVDAPTTLLEFVNDTLVSTYPPEPRNKVVSMWLLRTVTRLVDACPLSLFQASVEAVQEGLQTWISDEYHVFTQEEYSFDILPVYETVALCMQSLGPSVEVLTALAPLLESGFTGRDDKPESVASAFRDYWDATFAEAEIPEHGWPERLVPYIPSLPGEVSQDAEAEETASSSVSADSYEASTKGSDLELPETVEDSEDVVLATLEPAFKISKSVSVEPEEEPASGPSMLPVSPIRLLRAIELPSTPKASVFSSPTSPPHRPRKRDTVHAFSPLVPALAGTVTVPATPQRSPRTPRKLVHSGDKENASPRPFIISVMDRIAMQSPVSSQLRKRVAVNNLEEERPAKRGRLSESPSLPRSRHPVLSPSQNRTSDSDSEDERLVVERNLFATPSPSKHQAIPVQSFYGSVTPKPKPRATSSASPSPSPAPVRKRKGVFMEAVEVPLLRDLRKLQRRESMQLVERQPLRRSLRRVQSLSLPRSSRPVVSSSKRSKLRPSASSEFSALTSSPLRGMAEARLLDSDDSVMDSKLNTPATAPPSSDDDPHVGQVTPHHLVSPAMRRPWYADPPSDDSTASVSPSREHVARRIFQHLGSGPQLVLGSPRLPPLSTEVHSPFE